MASSGRTGKLTLFLSFGKRGGLSVLCKPCVTRFPGFWNPCSLLKALGAPREDVDNLKLLCAFHVQDPEEMTDEAMGLVSRSLLHAVDGEYGMHDLVLDYARASVDRDELETYVSRQARYLSGYDALRTFSKAGKNTNDLVDLMILWRPLERLSDDPELQADGYEATLRSLRPSSPEDSSHGSRYVWAARTIARLFELQVGLAQMLGRMEHRAGFLYITVIGALGPGTGAFSPLLSPAFFPVPKRT